MKLIIIEEYLLLIDKEAEIFQMDYYIDDNYNTVSRATLTLDQYEGCVKIIAYYPLNSEAKELDLPLLPNPFEDDDVEKLAEENNRLIGIYKNDTGLAKSIYMSAIKNFKDGYKAAQSKQFSLEDLEKAWNDGFKEGFKNPNNPTTNNERDRFIQQIQQSRLPVDFIPEFNDLLCYNCEGAGWLLSCEKCNGKGVTQGNRIKIVTNFQGQKIVQGKYKFKN